MDYPHFAKFRDQGSLMWILLEARIPSVVIVGVESPGQIYNLLANEEIFVSSQKYLS